MNRYNKSSSKLPIIFLLILIVALVIYLPKISRLSKEKIFSKQEIESIVKETIENSPESILSSLEKHYIKRNNEAIEKSKKSVFDKKNQLEDKNSPSNRNKDYDVTIIEFFDYNCGYCKRASYALSQAIGNDAKIRVIYKELPILGDNSLEAAITALAINKIAPEKYIIFHDKLMNSKNIDKTVLDNLVKELDIDRSELYKIKSSSDINLEISNNKNLAQDLGINGTPAFIINEELISGAVDAQIFKKYIDNIRSIEKK